MAQTPDTVTLAKIAKAHPKVREELGKIYTEICTVLTGKARCRFIYITRSMEEQDALYAQGREVLASVNAKRAKAKMPPITAAENKNKVTNAPAGLSIHNWSLAVDIVLLLDEAGKQKASWDTKTDFDGDNVSDWLEIVAVFKKYGWVWGGDWSSFKDLPHFEKTFGKKASDLLIAWKAGKKDSEGYVLI
jgi:peptidoglycan LD-endopeptidase CwlK